MGTGRRPLPSGCCAESLTLVGGNNNQGKTSVLDALAWALGGDRFRPDAAQREGSVAPAHLKVILSNGVVVERKGKNSSLTVTDPTGRRSGQQLLNAFIEPLALDLPRFMEASDKEKADILLRIIGIGTELHVRDMEIKALYDKRTFTGQLAQQKKHFAEELIFYPDAPEEPVSASELIRQQQEILARNGENQRKRARLVSIKEKARQLSQRVQTLSHELSVAEHELSAAQDDLQEAQKSAEQLRDESTAELEAAIRNIEETNRKVRANLEKSRAEDEAAHYAEDYDRLTDQIQSKRADRMALLHGAGLPLPGLSVEDGVLTYNGKHWRDMSGSDQLRVSAAKRADRMALLHGAGLPLPGLSVEDGVLTYNGKHWRDMSGSDQLRVSAAIVRRLNPNCGFVLMDKLEQMDLATLQEFSAWLEAEGLQVIATRVSTGSECHLNPNCGFVLMDKLEQMDLATLQEFSAWLEAEGLQVIATRVSTGSECHIVIEDGMVKIDEPSIVPEQTQPAKSWTKGAF